MKAVQIVRFVDEARVLRLDMQGSVLVITGNTFSHATEVFVNGSKIHFTVVSDTLIEAELPSSMAATPVQEVQVLSETLSGLSGYSSASYKMTGGTVTGLAKLLQRYLKLLMTTPGSDAFHKSAGGGLLDVVGMSFDPDEPEPVIAQIVTAVGRAADQLKASQSRQKLPSSEMIRGATVLDIGFDAKRLGFRVKILLTTVSGDQIVSSFSAATIGS